ncbi:MAG: replicative DNA helicase [Planctomycetes bacterium]|mgnify:CR=1 FL=1|jgi:replicative DNA helicase|nr:replicative DNA helicase [Planctomycetota bacterium]HNZ65984.1 replicative DNA helicase [Planctomycetota bacterium]HPY74819.1 replicative DNA helicase [Planctomycetota bacterium]HQB00459.1 replicative DNA helicase [Planctomycetota bacterium]HRU52230.1 replicative DNA helicase [Planctomycetota bacterium]
MVENSRLPQSLEAEIGVLGSLLIEDSIAGEIIQSLQKSYFTKESHQILFEAIKNLYDDGKPIIPASIKEELKHKGVMQLTSDEYLSQLMGAMYSGGNASYFAEVVREKGIMRLLVLAAQDIIKLAESEQYTLNDLLDKAESIIFDITQKKISSEPVHIQHILLDVLAELDSNDEKNKGISTGFSVLDRIISGLQDSALIILAARPSMGKTSFALNMASHIGIFQRKGVLIFSLEMAKTQVARNMLCSLARISPHRFHDGSITPDERFILLQEKEALEKAPIYIDDTASMSLSEMRAKARRYKSLHDINLIIIDYIQLMESRGSNRTENRQQEISFISRGLKGLARELNIPVIGLSQLNRAVDARDDHRPRMSDLRESGALEQDADIIMFLYRDEYYFPDSQKQGMAEVIVAKHRNGPTGTADLFFFKQHMRFVTLSNDVPS